ncbi:rhodanese-like domain-containing protein [Geomesophilobacter sediminis]|uniref:Rhodanese-like domain-containing protein n=1 Tax=Geomesophilobacter sediminis TaxID=2798584 RepID=A0A8J7S7L9_9BACT|nr:rhodanese-like domain-containing protein [Geomesophilobacter sediminis]MBJ6727106.1 rhodanese-like domain-containing protein [Geomesophilobacter sediminis]
MKQQELIKRMAGKNPPTVVDVRTGIEFKRGRIPGALHAPGWRIFLGLSRIPADRQTELVVLCELGPRAQIAKSVLTAYGYRNVDLLEGHMAAWRQAGHPLER